MHKPVLLKEAVKYLNPRPGKFIIDGTLDGGGHALAILEKLSSAGMLLGIDLDREMILKLKERIAKNPKSKNQNPKIFLEQGNYADLPEILKNKKLPKADGLLLDLGFSSEQLESGRGFSFGPSSAEDPLLMTYDKERKPVAQILRELKENELADVIFRLGGERYSRRIAKAIKEKGKEKPIITSGELSETIRKAVPKNYERGRIDPATRTFQALRIYANDELANLKRALKNLPEVLNRGGRAVIISFHSLEDRLVKNSFRDYAKSGKVEILTKKPITADEEEIAVNPRARSSKLRAAKML